MAVFEINFYSKSLNRHVPLCVVLPTDKPWFPGMRKREEGKPYKTLYLLHGVTDNYTNWLYNTRIRRWAEDEDLAVVMPSGDNAFYVDQLRFTFTCKQGSGCMSDQVWNRAYI